MQALVSSPSSLTSHITISTRGGGSDKRIEASANYLFPLERAAATSLLHASVQSQCACSHSRISSAALLQVPSTSIAAVCSYGFAARFKIGLSLSSLLLSFLSSFASRRHGIHGTHIWAQVPPGTSAQD